MGGRPYGNRPHDFRCQLHIEADVRPSIRLLVRPSARPFVRPLVRASVRASARPSARPSVVGAVALPWGPVAPPWWVARGGF